MATVTPRDYLLEHLSPTDDSAVRTTGFARLVQEGDVQLGRPAWGMLSGQDAAADRPIDLVHGDYLVCGCYVSNRWTYMLVDAYGAPVPWSTMGPIVEASDLSKYVKMKARRSAPALIAAYIWVKRNGHGAQHGR